MEPRKPPSTATTTTSPVTAVKVTNVSWERGLEPMLVAWVRVSRDGESAAMRIQILPSLQVRSLHTGIGGPVFQLAAVGAVERYVEAHREEVEKLLRTPPG